MLRVSQEVADLTEMSFATRLRTTLPRDRTEAIVACLIVLVGVTFFHPGQWNQNARLAAIAAFVEPGTPYTGTFRIEGLKDGPRFLTSDWAESRGEFYSNKAPGVTMLGVVPYAVLYHAERLAGFDPTTLALTQTNAFLINVWTSVFWNVIAALALLRRLPNCRLHTRAGAIVASAVYAFATLVLPFGCSPWGHSTAAAFITLGTLTLLDAERPRAGRAGLWFGLAVLTEYLAGLSLAVAALFTLGEKADGWSERVQRVGKFALGCTPPLVALLLYQKVCFGSYLTPAPSLSNPGFLEPDKVAGLFGLPNRDALWLMFVSLNRGIFTQMPVLALSAAGAWMWLRSGRRKFVAFALVNIACYALSVSSMKGWEGGGTTSMRYMIVALPFFCLLLPEIRGVVHRTVFLLLFAVSAVNMFVLAATTTMAGETVSFYSYIYAWFWHGEPAFNPLLGRLGIHGVVPALALGAVFACGVGWVLRSTFRMQPSFN